MMSEGAPGNTMSDGALRNTFMALEVGYRNNGHQFLYTKTDVRGPAWLHLYIIL